MMLVDRAAGTGRAISFFATEEDMRAGDQALNAMTPPVQGVGRRTSVELYEVAVEKCRSRVAGRADVSPGNSRAKNGRPIDLAEHA